MENNTVFDNKSEILKRLNRIEGQVKGIQRMIAEEKPCVDILTQISAIRAAINKVGGIVLERYSKRCVIDSFNSESKDDVMEELLNTIQKFLKFVD